MKANKNTLGYIGAVPGRDDSNSWNTPRCYLSSARKVLKGIGLDPFSSNKANLAVKAESFYTEEDDAFTTIWETDHPTVWMNPPYGRGVMPKAINRFISMYNAVKFDRAIVLTNNATETKWFQTMLSYSSMVCFPSKRIAFTSPDNKEISGNTRGQAFFLVGTGNVKKRFVKEFKQYGTIMEITHE